MTSKLNKANDNLKISDNLSDNLKLFHHGRY